MYFLKTKHLLPLVLGIFSSLLILLRSTGFDHDYDQYLEIYKNLSYTEIFSQDVDIEPAFEIFARISEFAGLDVTFFLFFCGLFALTIKLWVASRFGVATLLYFFPLYLSSFFFAHELNQTRISISVAFAYLMLLRNDNGPKTIIYSTIMTMFQYSSVLLVPFIAIKNRKILFCAFIALLLLLEYLKIDSSILSYLPDIVNSNPRFFGYTNELISPSSETVNFFNGGTILCLISIGFIWMGIRLKLFDSVENILCEKILTMLLFSLCFYFLFRNQPVLATRFAELLRVFTPLALAIFFSKAAKESSVSTFICLVFTIFFMLGNFVLYGATINPINDHFLKPVSLNRDL